MNKNILSVLGWVSLLLIVILWLTIGYSNWYGLLILVAYLLFSTGDGSIKKLNVLKKMSMKQIILILGSFILSVAIVFVLIQIAGYIILHVLHLTGAIRSIAIIVAVILSLYPVKFTFGSVIYKVMTDLKS